MSMEEWKEFFKIKRSVLFLLALAIVSSTLYVIYLEHTKQLSKEMLQYYVMQKEMPFEMRHFLAVFVVYFKRCLLVWFLGLFAILTPLSLLMVFVYIFSYGFSITSLYVCFGLEGLWMGMLTFGVQCVVMVSYLLHLEDCILKKKHLFGEITQKSYLLFILMGIGIAFITALVESLIVILL